MSIKRFALNARMFRRLLATRMKVRKVSRRVPVQKYPMSLERAYQRKLRGMVGLLKDLTTRRLLPRLKALSDDAYEHRPESSVRRDAWPDVLDEVLDDIRVEYGRYYSREEIEKLAQEMGISVSAFHDKAYREQLFKLLGIDVVQSEPWLADQLAGFTYANVNLIESIEEKFFGRIESTVAHAFTTGMRWEEVSKDISSDYDVSESQADLIARDQIGKLNGNLTQLRQADLGITGYYWRTSQDERVRDVHIKLGRESEEGRIFYWDDPPVTNSQGDKNHPGGDYRCRCYAEPAFDTVEPDGGGE